MENTPKDAILAEIMKFIESIGKIFNCNDILSKAKIDIKD